MAETEIDILGEAFRGTEQEIFGDAAGAPPEALDESGDRSVEEMGEGLEGQHEPDEDAEDAAASDEALADGDGAARDKAGRFVEKDGEPKPEGKDGKEPATQETQAQPDKGKTRVPLAELESERQKRQSVEQERDALRAEREADRKALADLNAKMDGLIRQQQPNAKPATTEQQAQVSQIPDPFTNPDGYAAYVRQQAEQVEQRIEQRIEHARVEGSLQQAAERHGDLFKTAYSALTSQSKDDPGARAIVQQIWRSPNPGEALVSWHRNQETLREVGGDPNAYKARIADEARKSLMSDPEFRKQVLDGLRAEASGQNGSPPRTAVRMPKSLNGAAGSSAHEADPSLYDNSERSVFESAMG